MPNITLYHTDGCHLCEQAFDLLIQAGLEENVNLIDIVESEALMAEYQTNIPVAQFNTGTKLFWPFTLEDILNNK
ncbi:glutaredoxin family protein [Pseudoalteromonas sp.]|uniref:glutaredoxin family protein n=1 Tax=Pseudoalteromonas sp. TaxID=53249 RepID=UPI0035661494